MHLFGRSADLWLRLTLLAGAGTATLGTVGAWALTRDGYATPRTRYEPQPVPFSHAHHVGGLRIDCRYCHQHVEISPSAGMPATATCMGCHQKVWPEAPPLAPVRESWRTGQRLRWNRVHDLPDYVYFDHSIHVARGVGCSACHGPVHLMPLIRREAPLTMQWCLDCHRRPWQHLRPRDAVFDPAWVPPPDQEARGRRLMAEHGIDPASLDRCSICHR